MDDSRSTHVAFLVAIGDSAAANRFLWNPVVQHSASFYAGCNWVLAFKLYVSKNNIAAKYAKQLRHLCTCVQYCTQRTH